MRVKFDPGQYATDRRKLGQIVPGTLVNLFDYRNSG